MVISNVKKELPPHTKRHWYSWICLRAGWVCRVTDRYCFFKWLSSGEICQLSQKRLKAFRDVNLQWVKKPKSLQQISNCGCVVLMTCCFQLLTAASIFVTFCLLPGRRCLSWLLSFIKTQNRNLDLIVCYFGPYKWFSIKWKKIYIRNGLREATAVGHFQII